MSETLNQKQLFATIVAEYIATLEEMLSSEHVPLANKEQIKKRLAELKKIEFELPLVPATNANLTSIEDWIKLNRGKISARLIGVLHNFTGWNVKKPKYIEQLVREDLLSSRNCGLLTWKEFEKIRKEDRMKGNQDNSAKFDI